MADIGATMSEITADIRTIVRGEIELAKTEFIPGAKKAGLGAGLFAVAAVMGLIAVNVLFLCLGFAYTALLWNPSNPVGAFALGFLLAVLTYLLIAGIFAVVGVMHVKKLRKPEAAIEQASKTVDAVTNAKDSGLTAVKLIATRGRKTITRDETGQLVTVFSGPKNVEPPR